MFNRWNSMVHYSEPNFRVITIMEKYYKDSNIRTHCHIIHLIGRSGSFLVFWYLAHGSPWRIDLWTLRKSASQAWFQSPMHSWFTYFMPTKCTLLLSERFFLHSIDATFCLCWFCRECLYHQSTSTSASSFHIYAVFDPKKLFASSFLNTNTSPMK